MMMREDLGTDGSSEGEDRSKMHDDARVCHR